MAGYEVQRLTVMDMDAKGTAAWRAVYSIVRGNEGGAFSISTDPESNEGILQTAKVSVNRAGTTGAMAVPSRLSPGHSAYLHGDPVGLIAAPSTLQGLDYEAKQQFTLYVAVANEDPLMVKLPTSTATVVVTVRDINEAPIFSPPVKMAQVLEDMPVGQTITTYAAQDPDSSQSQKIK